MSRTLSTDGMKAVLARETDEEFVTLLVLTHETFAEPLRFNDSANIVTHDGDDYEPFPFQGTLLSEPADAPPAAHLAIDNTDQRIGAAISQTAGKDPVSVNFKIVRASDPDVIEAAYPDLRLTGVSEKLQIVQGGLTVEDFTSEPFPGDNFTPAKFPALF